ncbi:MAG: winged helix-turn-helix transcriptional regulator [Ilumatobacteraceae bacterium]|nr:winged helix-turn-helix transcriptional regulator [Ilumatobacteraceae bacterium]
MHSPAFVITSCARFLERRLDDQLPLSQYRILAMLGDAPERAGRVSRLLELSKPAVTDAVDGLVDRGLAIRRVDDNDRRAVAVTITEAGCEMLADIEERLGLALDEIIEHCDDPDCAAARWTDLHDELPTATSARGPRSSSGRTVASSTSATSSSFAGASRSTRRPMVARLRTVPHCVAARFTTRTAPGGSRRTRTWRRSSERPPLGRALSFRLCEHLFGVLVGEHGTLVAGDRLGGDDTPCGITADPRCWLERRVERERITSRRPEEKRPQARRLVDTDDVDLVGDRVAIDVELGLDVGAAVCIGSAQREGTIQEADRLGLGQIVLDRQRADHAGHPPVVGDGDCGAVAIQREHRELHAARRRTRHAGDDVLWLL